MIINLDERDPGEVIECDLCIAGSGAAGLSIAVQFLDQKRHTVVVLEAGDRDFTEASQDFYQGRNLGLDYFDLDVSRLRYFGGTTNHWGGWCRPLDPMDFEARPWVPHSGWPIGPEDLAVFRPKAHQILDLAGLDYAPENIVLADISQMSSKYREIIPPFHRQRNCIPSAAIRWLDSGDRHALRRPFAQIFRHSDTPFLSFSPGRRFPRPTPERVFVVDHQSGSGYSETVPSAPLPRPIGT
jgi:choline dehydrogenase-like flavoprotein